MATIRFQAGNIPFREVGANNDAGFGGTRRRCFFRFSVAISAEIVKPDAQALESRSR